MAFVRQSIEQMLVGLDPEIASIVRNADKIINPRGGMTAFEAHLHSNEEIYRQFYAEQIDAECDDPLDVIERREQDVIAATGRNYSGRIL